MTGWDALARELDAWEAAGRAVTLWWRDDDAEDETPELRAMLGLAEAHRVPLALAVIPARATPALLRLCAPPAAALQHGWAHRNHAAPGAKKAELGADRPLAAVEAELKQGRARLAELSAGAAPPVLVPPWNRIAPAVIARLPALGFRGLSAFAPRRAEEAAPGLVTVNTHADAVDWRRRAFAGEDAVLAALVGHLAARRSGAADAAEPTGLLTHHRVDGAACRAFLGRLLAATSGRACWCSARALFAGG